MCKGYFFDPNNKKEEKKNLLGHAYSPETTRFN